MKNKTSCEVRDAPLDHAYFFNLMVTVLPPLEYTGGSANALKIGTQLRQLRFDFVGMRVTIGETRAEHLVGILDGLFERIVVGLVAAGTAKQGAALDLQYSVRLKDALGTLALLAELNRVEGVQSVEWNENFRNG